MKFVYWWTISDNGWSNLPLARRPVVGYLNRSIMASNRICNTSIINLVSTSTSTSVNYMIIIEAQLLKFASKC